MLIVIEGLDRTGKTTLADQLADEFRLDYRHADKPTVHPLEEYLRPVESGPRRAVFDRYHLGEIVWPQIFGRRSDYDAAMHLHVDLTLKSRGAVLIHPLRKWQAGELEEALRGEPLDAEQWRRANELFVKLFHGSRLPVFPWCLCHNTLERRGPFIAAAGRLAHEARRLSATTPRWIGSTQPDVLLVGEQVGPGGQGEWTLPFVPFRGTSGHFLFTELAGLPLDFQRRVAVVNALKPDGSPELVAELYDVMTKLRGGNGQYPTTPRVVALGKTATRELDAQGVPHRAVHHPQYVRRFLRRKGPGWYGQQILKEAV